MAVLISVKIDEDLDAGQHRLIRPPSEPITSFRLRADIGVPRWNLPTTKEIPMNPTITELLHKISVLEDELAVQMALVHANLRMSIEEGKIRLDEAVAHRHREMKANLARYVLGACPLIALTAPVIYSLIVPLVLLDLFISIYQAVCFPVYGIAKVRRKDYLIFDRRYLAYLTSWKNSTAATAPMRTV
jgi:hypothetical protein